jgi:hypothetical protein
MPCSITTKGWPWTRRRPAPAARATNYRRAASLAAFLGP